MPLTRIHESPDGDRLVLIERHLGRVEITDYTIHVRRTGLADLWAVHNGEYRDMEGQYEPLDNSEHIRGWRVIAEIGNFPPNRYVKVYFDRMHQPQGASTEGGAGLTYFGLR